MDDSVLFWLYAAGLAWVPLALRPEPDAPLVRVWTTPVLLMPLIGYLGRKMLSERSRVVLTRAGIRIVGPNVDKTFPWDTISVTPKKVVDFRKDIGQSIFLASAELPPEWYVTGGGVRWSV